MIWTLLVGNGLYAAAVYGFWFMVDGDRAKFVPAFIFATITFFAGIVTGIVANQPRKTKKKKWRKGASSVSSDAFDSLGEATPSAVPADTSESPGEEAAATPTPPDAFESITE